jgi:hypothetical protein
MKRRDFCKIIMLPFFLGAVNAKADDSFVSIDEVVSTLVALGVPGLVVLAIAATTGLAGGAAMLTAISTMGGPFGILGGVIAIAALALAVKAIAKYGFKYVAEKVIEGLEEKGYSRQQIKEEIESYPISELLKAKLAEIL